MPRTTSLGIQTPTAGDRHPSEQWWSTLGATTTAAIDKSVGSLSEAVKRDFVPRTEAEQYGIPGPPNVLSVGTVAGGVTAGASITGTSPSQTLNLTLPIGPRGPEGPGGAFQMRETADPGLFEVSDVSNAVVAAAVSAGMDGKIVPDGTDINTLRSAGLYIVPTVTSARTMINWPTVRAGTLEVRTRAGASLTTQHVTAYVSTTAEPEQYIRATLLASSWPSWYTSGWAKGIVPDGTDLGAWRNPGVYGIASETSAKTFKGLPTDAAGAVIAGAGHLETMPTTGSGRTLQRLTMEVAGKLRVWARTTGLTASFPAWQENTAAPTTGGSTEVPAAGLVAEVNQNAGHRHNVLRNHFRARRGGRIGTGGRGVYCIRIDHWLGDFERDLMPALVKYGLPCSIAMNAKNWGVPVTTEGATAPGTGNNGSVTPETLQDWSLRYGFDVTNHSQTHAGTNDPDGIVREIVTGQRELQAQLPRLVVDEWHMPGVASTLAYNGFGNGNRLENWTDTLAGRAILHSHGHASGYMQGFWHELMGEPQIGEMPQGADNRALSDRIADVEQVARLGKGLVHLIHGNAVASGQLTVADWEAFCAHIAAMRDEGRLLVLTTAGEAVADARTDHRAEILDNAGFDGGFTGWTGATGWTADGDGQASATTTAGMLSQAMLLHSRHGWVQGSQVELVCQARATASSTLGMQVSDLSNAANFDTGTRSFALPGDNVWRSYRVNLTIPRPHDLTQFKIQVGRLDGGALQVRDLHMRPI
jgi:hypothetical protein